MSRVASCILIILVVTAIAEASPCRSNDWQPTYVHDLVNNDGIPYYVMPDGSFVELTGDWTNQSGPGMCCLYGVRDSRGFTTCFDYTRVQCGCDLESAVNDTCRRFLALRGSSSLPGPQGTVRILSASSGQDLVGPSEEMRGDGVSDAVFEARVRLPGRTVTAVSVSNITGTRSIWDTVPRNGMWLGVVVTDAGVVNRSDGSVVFTLGPGETRFRYYCQDNGSIRAGATTYRMVLTLDNGEQLSFDVQR